LPGPRASWRYGSRAEAGRAIAAARAAKLGTSAAKLIDDAPRYPEGTGIRLRVSRARQIPLIRKLARIKLEN
jgi:hypothetical protein